MSAAAPSDLAALEEQRDFLLRSLEDLEREHAAGDVDEHDYAALKDDYTARAAAVLRAIDAGRSPAKAAERRSPGRRLISALAVVAFAGLAGLLVTQTSGRRDPGELGSGDIRQSVTQKLNEANRLFAEGRLDDAIDLFDEVLVDQPTNPEALTYKGWALYQAGEPEEALTSLLDAATANPEYPDAHAFLAVVFFRTGLVEQADRELVRLDALDPSPVIVQLVEELRTEVDAALATRSTTTTTTPTP